MFIELNSVTNYYPAKHRFQKKQILCSYKLEEFWAKPYQVKWIPFLQTFGNFTLLMDSGTIWEGERGWSQTSLILQRSQ